MYQITLTNAEMETLQWAAARGYFPKETLDAMTLTVMDAERMELDEQRGEQFLGTPYADFTNKDSEYTYNIPEYKAWAIIEQRTDDPDSLYTCIDSPLIEKLIALENSIV